VNEVPVSIPETKPIRLPDRPCPVCGVPAAAMLATLPSGRKVLVEACAICGRQEAAPVDSPRADPPEGKQAAQRARELA